MQSPSVATCTKRSKLLLLSLAAGAGLAAWGYFAAQPAAVAVSPPVLPAYANTVTPHKALYDFSLVSVTSGAGVTDIRGHMFYEQDDACDAWTTDHRFTVTYYYPERQPLVNTSHYVAWEAKDQSQFQFSSERQENGVVTELLRGFVAREKDGAATAEYVRPDDLTFSLPQGYFLPTGHINEILKHAKAGDRFFNAVMFDGTDADGPIEASVFIGDKLTPEQLKQHLPKVVQKGKTFDRALLSPNAWPVRMAIFPLVQKDSMTPAYEMDLILHDNSVVSYALVDYKSFKVEQRLTALEPLPIRKCP